MYSTYETYKYKCVGCNTDKEKMAVNQPEDVKECFNCSKKEPIRFTLDGAPSGFVRNGTSNSAGFSSGKVFNGN